MDEPGFLEVHDLQELAAAGMKIGSHGLLHRSWRDLSDTELDEELRESRRRLEGVLGAPVDWAACPFGAYDRRVLRRVRAAGYRRLFTSDGGPAPRDSWLQPRISVRAWDDAASIAAAITPSGGRRVAKAVRRRLRAWR